VDAAINFDNKLVLRAECIEHKRAERVLPAELETGESPTSQCFPEFVLGGSWPMAQLSGCKDYLTAGFAASWTGHASPPGPLS